MADVFALHFLEESDRDVAELFGAHTGDDEDKFAECSWEPGVGGVRLLERRAPDHRAGYQCTTSVATTCASAGSRPALRRRIPARWHRAGRIRYFMENVRGTGASARLPAPEGRDPGPTLARNERCRRSRPARSLTAAACALSAGLALSWTAPAPAQAQKKQAARRRPAGPPRAAPRRRPRPPRSSRCQGVQGRAALLRPPRDRGLVGQPDGRPQGPADRLRPVRQALPRHPAARRRPAAETKVEPIAVEIGEAQGLLWAFDSLYVVVNAGGQVPERPLPRPRHRRRRHARQGRAAPQARRRRRARPARRRPRRPTASRSTSSPATRRSSPSSPARSSRGSGARTSSCPGCPTAAASWPTRRPPAAASTGSTPTARTGSSSRWASATPTTSPSTATATCSRTTPTWSGT